MKDGQKDGQTDGRTDERTRLLMLSRDSRTYLKRREITVTNPKTVKMEEERAVSVFS